MLQPRCLGLAVLFLTISTRLLAAPEPYRHAGFITNPPAVYALVLQPITNIVDDLPVSRMLPPESLPNDLRRAMLAFRYQASRVPGFATNKVFAHFLPESLSHHIWTNTLARTNGRTVVVWSERTHPPKWPAEPPALKWEHRSVIWGMQGLTALSPCWELEGSSGQIPITALTRRHGYTRGHGMGEPGFRQNYAGKKVWFVTTADRIVEVKVLREVVRTRQKGDHDYTILLFDRDLPPTIQPLRVLAAATVVSPSSRRYPYCSGAPFLVLMTEQGGCVSTGLPGFTVPTGKGGDSGSPNLFPVHNELLFWGGRTTSFASPEMQSDMDELCRLEGLKPAKYQMQWADLKEFPAY
jgi:hypothetical protein